MPRTYLKAHRGTGEWSRKIRKATETRRVRRVVKETLRHTTLTPDVYGAQPEVTSPGGAEHL